MENNHHVTYIDEYVNIICDAFRKEYIKNRTMDDFSMRFTEADFAHIPNKFFTECRIVLNYKYSENNSYGGGYNLKTVVVDEDEKTKSIESLPLEQRVFNQIYFVIVVELEGNSLTKLLRFLSTTLGHEMTHALQHIRMKMGHNESFTDGDYLNSYTNIVKDVASDENEAKDRLASFLYYTDANEVKANISEFYNELGDITEDDIVSKEKVVDILKQTKLWEIIEVMGHRVKEYNKLTDNAMKNELIQFYNEYFPQDRITNYRDFRRKMNGRWNNFYCGIVGKLVSMIREKATQNQQFKEHGPTKPLKIK